MKTFAQYLKEDVNKNVFVMAVEDAAGEIQHIKKYFGITDAKVVKEPKNYYFDAGFGDEGDDNDYIQFTDTSDNKGMKYYLQGHYDDDTDNDIALNNPKELKKWLDRFRVA